MLSRAILAAYRSVVKRIYKMNTNSENRLIHEEKSKPPLPADTEPEAAIFVYNAESGEVAIHCPCHTCTSPRRRSASISGRRRMRSFSNSKVMVEPANSK